MTSGNEEASSRRAGANPARWSLREVTLVLLAIVLAGPAVLLLLMSGLIPEPEGSGAGVFWVAVALAYYGVPAALLWLLASRRPTGAATALGFKPVDSGLLAGGAVAAFMLAFVFNLTYLLVVSALGATPPARSLQVIQELVSSFDAGAGQALLVGAVVVLIAPLFEEAFFRGVALGCLSERFGDVFAVAATSVVFAAIHLDAWRFLPLALFGAVLAVLTRIAGSVWPAVLAHVLVNGFAFMWAFALHVSSR